MAALSKSREAALKALVASQKDDAYLNIVLRDILSSMNMDTRDNALATTIAFGVMKNRLFIDNIIENLLNTNSYKMYDMLIHKAVTQTILITTSFLQKVKSVVHANMINVTHGIHNKTSHLKHICNNLFIYLQISKISSTNTFSPFSIF